MHELRGATPWSVENAGACPRTALGPPNVFVTSELPGGAWYISCILQREKAALEAFFQGVPLRTPPVLPDARHDGGVWVFLGANSAADKEVS